jgi:hypothetical protein
VCPDLVVVLLAVYAALVLEERSLQRRLANLAAKVLGMITHAQRIHTLPNDRLRNPTHTVKQL